MKKCFVGMCLFLVVVSSVETVFAEEADSSETEVESSGWSLDGGAPWKNRIGPGLQLAIGGNTCTDDFCTSTMDVKFFGSFGGTFSFFYRFIPNLVAFADIHTGYVRTNYVGGLDKDRGFLFQFTVGAEFHVPITGWLDAYLGLGIGYALLRFKGETDAWGEQVLSYRGVDIELKLGVDVYPISAAPTFAAGLLFRYGFGIWPTACLKYGNESFDCVDPKAQDPDGLEGVSRDPNLIFFGLAARYGF